MLASLGIIFILGLMMGGLFKIMKLPPLLGMLVVGIVIGPYMLNLISPTMMSIAGDLRLLALIIILLRAGLSLKWQDLKSVGRPALLMCFVPACFELVTVVLLAPQLLGMSILDAAILGSVLAAVSPAVIVPKMLTLMQEGYGTKKSIPQMILAGASVDDIFVLVLFSVFTGMSTGESVNATAFLSIPISIILGVVIGVCSGGIIGFIFKKIHMRDSAKVLLLLAISFFFVTLEQFLKPIVGVSAMLAVISLGVTVLYILKPCAVRLCEKLSKLWVAAEILLFVLVGAMIDLRYAVTVGVGVLLLLAIALIMRMIGVWVCMIKTSLTKKERLFCAIAYLPKATVQAAIGAVPLSMGLECGGLVLTVAVVAILITAPLGAICIENTYRKLLTKSD